MSEALETPDSTFEDTVKVDAVFNVMVPLITYVEKSDKSDRGTR